MDPRIIGPNEFKQTDVPQLMLNLFSAKPTTHTKNPEIIIILETPNFSAIINEIVKQTLLVRET